MLNIRIYEAYLTKKIYLSIFFVSLLFISLFILFDFLFSTEKIGQSGYSFWVAFIYTILQAPMHFYAMLPLVVLIAAIYVFTALAKNSEFIIFRLAGLSKAKILYSIWKIGIPIILLTYLVGELISPYTVELGNLIKLQALAKNQNGSFLSGVWLKDMGYTFAGGRRFINIHSFNLNQTISGIDIFEFDEQLRLRFIWHAKIAAYQQNNHQKAYQEKKLELWLLHEVQKIELLKVANQITNTSIAKTFFFKELIMGFQFNPKNLELLLLTPGEMSLLNLYKYSKYLKNNKQSSQLYDLALWKKLLYPLTILVMLTLALPCAYANTRSSNSNIKSIGLKAFLGLLIGISFYLVNSLFSNIGQIGNWHPIIVGLLPVILYFLLAIVVLYKST